jgi:glycosyltransferase involved in cell wall biosynthesis
MAAAMFLRIRHVLSLPGGDTVWLPAIGYGGLTSALRRRLVRSCCAAADEVIVLTEYQKQHAAQNGLPLSRAVVIPFGVDTSEFAFQPMQFSLPLRLISIGSLNRVKNIFLQIEAYAILRRSVDCQFTIVGEDVNSGEARKFADSLHVGRLIQWMGHCAHTEIAGFLHNAHMLMHTALYEAEGVVIMEAFSAGTIVAGTRVGLLAETDSDGRCTIDGNDPALLAEKILTLWRDGQLTARLRETNRRYAERTSIDWTAGKYAELYSEVIRTDASP